MDRQMVGLGEDEKQSPLEQYVLQVRPKVHPTKQIDLSSCNSCFFQKKESNHNYYFPENKQQVQFTRPEKPKLF